MPTGRVNFPLLYILVTIYCEALDIRVIVVGINVIIAH